MSPTGQLLTLLQHSDSAFPSGSVSFSSGLERLVADGFVTDGTSFTAMLFDAIKNRWNTFDRVFLARSFVTDAAGRCAIDREFEASVFCANARASSRRAGLAMLGTWSRMDDPEAIDYRALVHSGLAFGHLPIVHGLVYASAGLDLPTAETAACWTTASALANAAIRIGAIGPLSAQGALTELREEFAALLDEPVGLEDPPSAWTPVQDIAQARHTLADLRLFAS